ncbi:fumarylacetoacetate hydrolase family protein [soil metagenome]
MRIANINDRLVLVIDNTAIDVEHASAGRFGSNPQAVYAHWDDFVEWAETVGAGNSASFDPTEAGPPVPRPPQVFAIGLNYRDHAAEADLELPTEPIVFAKFPSSITGPHADVHIPTAMIDFEVELVAVIAHRLHHADRDTAIAGIAGYTVGQDFSDRELQWSGQTPQFSLGKSLPGFSPIGPVVVTPDELEGAVSLTITCDVSGDLLQNGNTRNLIFDVPELIVRLTRTVVLQPGDLIFTGTPAGVGAVRKPPRFLLDGDVVTSEIAGIGRMRHRMMS